MNNKLLTLVITATIGIILTCALLMPIINEYADGEQDTFTNGNTYMQYDTADSMISITKTKVSVDGTQIDGRNGFYVISNNFFVYASSGSNHLAYLGGSDITLGDSAEYTVTIADGSATINNGTTDVETVDCSGFYMKSDTATDYVIKTASSGIFYKDIGSLMCVEMFSTNFYALYDGKLYINGVDTEYTVSSGSSAVDGYDGLYSTSANLALATESTTVTMSYQYIAPANVEATVTGSDDTPSTHIIAAIPIIVIVGLILILIPRRND